jgi:hypothetical protein
MEEPGGTIGIGNFSIASSAAESFLLLKNVVNTGVITHGAE